VQTTPSGKRSAASGRPRAFEAIARLGSVTLAAQELDISPSAVSHQLRCEGLQMPLTERQGRRLVLSQHGREYYRSIRV
jgi:DNA-binding transcriptional LysR family regulator